MGLCRCDLMFKRQKNDFIQDKNGFEIQSQDSRFEIESQDSYKPGGPIFAYSIWIAKNWEAAECALLTALSCWWQPAKLCWSQGSKSARYRLGSWPAGPEHKINVDGGRKFSLDNTIAGKNSSYKSLYLLAYLLSWTDLWLLFWDQLLSLHSERSPIERLLMVTALETREGSLTQPLDAVTHLTLPGSLVKE